MAHAEPPPHTPPAQPCPRGSPRGGAGADVRGGRRRRGRPARAVRVAGPAAAPRRPPLGPGRPPGRLAGTRLRAGSQSQALLFSRSWGGLSCCAGQGLAGVSGVGVGTPCVCRLRNTSLQVSLMDVLYHIVGASQFIFQCITFPFSCFCTLSPHPFTPPHTPLLPGASPVPRRTRCLPETRRMDQWPPDVAAIPF